MMMNLFSIFDPTSSLNFSLNWLSISIIMIIMPFQFWFIPSRYLMSFFIIFNFLMTEFSMLIKYSMSNMIMFLSLFMLILMNNLFGLLPYIFTSSSHMSFCLSLSLSMWLSMMIFAWLNFFNDMISHLTPLSTPNILIPFMIIIELISLMIRPLTLAIRLTANMIAGHILLTLLGNSNLNILNIMNFILIISSQIILLILEIAVSFIQSYVFTILSTLYSSEI